MLPNDSAFESRYDLSAIEDRSTIKICAARDLPNSVRTP